MAKCAGCGIDLPSDAIFCPQCARRVAVQAPAPVEAPGMATISDVQTITGVGVSKSAVALAEGDLFNGRYRIERQLGAGAMGVVYAAKDQVANRTVALKLINPALADRPTARERFLREGLMARDVRHANVVAMYDVGESAGQVYLVMEYLSGETLRKWLRRSLQEGRDISFDTSRGIIRAILEGLVAAHATGVVHRDLKPENVMLMADPHEGRVSLKILDFGIARAVGVPTSVTTTSSSTGTPLYMAPEQKTAADTVGPAADLYAVTAMLYELLLGVAPEGRWGVPSHERNDLPAGIDQIIETGLANRPRSRYQSADEYIKALDAVRSIPAVKPEPDKPPAPPPKPPEPPGKGNWLTRSPGWALWKRLTRKQRYIVVIGLVIVLAVIGYYNQPPEPQVPPQPPPPADMNIAGRWSDSLTGSVVLLGYVDFVQQGNQVSGVIYNAYRYHAGTFSGRVQGTSLEYGYTADNGMTGTGAGRLTADGMHLEIVVQDTLTGNREQHTLHRNHMPNQ